MTYVHTSLLIPSQVFLNYSPFLVHSHKCVRAWHDHSILGYFQTDSLLLIWHNIHIHIYIIYNLYMIYIPWRLITIRWSMVNCRFPHQTSVQRQRWYPASEGYIWARSWSDLRVKNCDTETKELNYLRFNIDSVRMFGCKSDHRSASRSHDPYFSDILVSLARFQCWTISHFFMCLGDYSPYVGKYLVVNCRNPNPDQRATTSRCPAAASPGANIPQL